MKVLNDERRKIRLKMRLTIPMEFKKEVDHGKKVAT